MANIITALKNFFSRAFKFRYGSRLIDYDRAILNISRQFSGSLYNRYSGYITAGDISFGENIGYLRFRREFEMMDQYDIISAALDIYASEATFKDVKTGRVIWVESSDSEVKEILEALFDRINIEDSVYEIARGIAKYGNDFNLIIFSKTANSSTGYRVEYLDYIHPINMRVVNVNGQIYYLYIYDMNLAETMTQAAAVEKVRKMLNENKREEDGCMLYEEWNIIHFYLSNRQRGSLYGTSILEPVVLAWRRLTYLENAMWFRKLRESVSRYVYYVPIGEANVESAEAKIKAFIDMIKTSASFGQRLSDFKYKYESWLEDDDLYIPVRSERDPTKIETLEPRQYDVMDEIDYFLDKIAGGLRIPKTYLLFREQTDKTTLGMQDMRFAKAIMRLQHAIISGVEKLCAIELLAHGYNPFECDYKVKMTQPSVVFDIASWDAENQKLDVADKLSRFFPTKWILKYFFNLSDEEIKEIDRMQSGVEEEEAEGFDIGLFGEKGRKKKSSPDWGVLSGIVGAGAETEEKTEQEEAGEEEGGEESGEGAAGEEATGASEEETGSEEKE